MGEQRDTKGLTGRSPERADDITSWRPPTIGDDPRDATYERGETKTRLVRSRLETWLNDRVQAVGSGELYDDDAFHYPRYQRQLSGIKRGYEALFGRCKQLDDSANARPEIERLWRRACRLHRHEMNVIVDALWTDTGGGD